MKHQLFIEEHRLDDVRQLALSLHDRPAEECRFILRQIEGWQRLRTKVPQWAACPDLLYPDRLPLEQCSGQETALYKAGLVEGGELLVDLTGGLGVDFGFMARRFRRAVYVERDAELCRLARHNLPLLGLTQAEVREGDGVAYLEAMEEVADVIYMDPFRRDGAGRKTVRIEDCTPDVAALLPLLRRRCRLLVVKLSPMLDITAALRALGAGAGSLSLHIVGSQGEVKEIVVCLRMPAGTDSAACGQETENYPADRENCRRTNFSCRRDSFSSRRTKDEHSCGTSPQREDERGASTDIVCAEGGLRFAFTPDEAASAPMAIAPGVEAGQYLYDPSPVLMKAGCFALLAQRFGLRQLHPNSHLFTSDRPVQGFPGRAFRLTAVWGLGRQEQKKLRGSQMNLAVRNFPLSVAALKQRLRLRDGGACYAFATTLADGTHALLTGEKAGSVPTAPAT